MHKTLTLSAGLVMGALFSAPSFATGGKTESPLPTGPVKLERIAYFPEQQITGVAVTHSGRIFVSLPRLSQDVPVTLGEVVDGKITPYPDTAWNGYRSQASEHNDPQHQFVSAQAVVMDHQGMLWVLDAAAPNRTGPIVEGVKLVQIDPSTNSIKRVFRFDPSITQPGSSLNDVRFSPDDRFAYLTNVGKTGGLAVADLKTGRSWNVLLGDRSTQSEGVQLTKNGKPLMTPDGKKLELNADGIEISPDGKTLYWQALTGKTLYSLPTAVLQSEEKAKHAVPDVAAHTHAADGLWIDRAGRFYVSSPGENAIEVADHVGAPLKKLVKDEAMRWPDSFAQDKAGNLYISASFIGDSPWFDPTAKTTPSAIFKISPAKAE
ncbi:SMP-30/gluconolactonase/LRE family protein [Chimaeribacter californicus]|nr:L-dopachrome tautomerase-related protein [Chimaeribacter californicus]